MQEEILQFSSFTNADAWELGNLIVAEAAKRGAAVLVRIRLNNGYTVFQYGMDGTNLYHEQWLTRKENTEGSTPSVLASASAGDGFYTVVFLLCP